MINALEALALSMEYTDGQGGGGGTVVEANPSGQATADLTKLKVASTIYGLLTKAVDDLANYYLKTETYSKTEVDNIITALKNTRFAVVEQLPTTDIQTNVIYLVPKSSAQTENVYDEYINTDGTSAGWEKIGDTEIDLSGYVTTSDLTTILGDYIEKSATSGLMKNDGTVDTNSYATVTSVNDVKNNIIANTQLIEDSLGFSARNELTYPYYNSDNYEINGVTFTVNADKSVTANGTAGTGGALFYFRETSNKYNFPYDVIINGLPSQGSSTTFNFGGSGLGNIFDVAGKTVTANTQFAFCIEIRQGYTCNNLVFKPMIRKATILDDTYNEPRHTTAFPRDEQSYLSAKNLLHHPYQGQKTDLTNITLTVDSDGVVNFSGTTDTNNDGYYYFSNRQNMDFKLPKGTYKLTGGLSEDVSILVARNTTQGNPSGGSTYLGADTGNGLVFTLDALADMQVVLTLKHNKTFNATTVKPLLTLASDTDRTFTPYTMTNKQLTDMVQGIIDAVNSSADYSAFKTAIASL